MQDFLKLPTEVLIQILKLVEVRHRLSSCSLVHSTWAAAAVAATDSIHTDKDADVDVYDMMEWLETHCQHITSLDFYAGWQDLLYVPSSNLRSLQVWYAAIALEPPEAYLSINCLKMTTGLTRLELQRCNMARNSDTLSVLSALSDLQHLVLNFIGLPGVCMASTAPDDAVWAAIPGSLFSQLVKLTHLDLTTSTGGMTRETFEHLGCLTDLQHLALSGVWADSPDQSDVTTEGMVGLSQLTELTYLSFHECLATFTAHSTPLLSPLTNLRDLRLCEVDVLDPVVLAGMTQLQNLDLSCLELLGGATGTAALLTVLQRMQQLTRLELNGSMAQCVEAPPAALAAAAAPAPAPAAAPESAAAPAAAPAAALAAAPGATGLLGAAPRKAVALPPADAAAGGGEAAAAAAAAKPYAALTACTQLRELQLTYCALPEGVWQHVFAPGKLLPHLTNLEIAMEVDGPYLTTGDLASLVQACPRLACLDVGERALQQGISLEPLLGLTELTRLNVQGQQQADVDVQVQLARHCLMASGVGD